MTEHNPDEPKPAHEPKKNRISLPPVSQLAYLGGIGLLALVGMLELPVAVAIGVGHVLASRSTSPDND